MSILLREAMGKYKLTKSLLDERDFFEAEIAKFTNPDERRQCLFLKNRGYFMCDNPPENCDETCDECPKAASGTYIVDKKCLENIEAEIDDRIEHAVCNVYSAAIPLVYKLDKLQENESENRVWLLEVLDALCNIAEESRGEFDKYMSVRVCVDPCTATGKAVDGTMTTQFEATYRSGAWRIDRVFRATCHCDKLDEKYGKYGCTSVAFGPAKA